MSGNHACHDGRYVAVCWSNQISFPGSCGRWRPMGINSSPSSSAHGHSFGPRGLCQRHWHSSTSHCWVGCGSSLTCTAKHVHSRNYTSHKGRQILSLLGWTCGSSPYFPWKLDVSWVEEISKMWGDSSWGASCLSQRPVFAWSSCQQPMFSGLSWLLERTCGNMRVPGNGYLSVRYLDIHGMTWLRRGTLVTWFRPQAASLAPVCSLFSQIQGWMPRPDGVFFEWTVTYVTWRCHQIGWQSWMNNGWFNPMAQCFSRS